ncbi:uncharacterized protein B0H64DRAFT_414384 [Chaetomium fimeti]|uniref:Uncharacterized protein n=1 Tax=Chaetomium fimeti TaxID=1854472 RepID=A0AAE0HPY0_9PEZI|nr:hypothetical protein B0H64DRAFT_414384 [Chaetomium fimeti]
MERQRALLSPVFEEQLGASAIPALVVHVDIRFTDPVIRSRYCRSYASSKTFEATNRICRGLVRRIERCSEEFITRKDSGALEMFKDDTYERKRGMGEWAERTYRSYQKQPLTVAHTKEVALAVHWMIGLFLRRHDESFQWLDCPAPELDPEGSETAVPSRDGPLSILSVPRSRFVEASQVFEFVPGYSIEIYFRSRNPHRRVPTFERRTRVTSIQTTPLTLFLSEDMLWKALQFANQALDSKKRQFDDHLRNHRELGSTHLEDDTLELSLRVQNHLGPAYDHVQRSIKSKLALFRDPGAEDCATFLSNVEGYLSHIRDEADAILSGTNDFEVRIAELKGVGWTLREPAKFALGPSASYGRRTIQAALDRIQTGVGDVIRGHNIAIHLSAHKRGHLVLDKAIVAHEKHGNPRETFFSHEDAQAAFVGRLKARVQTDIDKIFEDSCSIDDIPEDDDDYFLARPVTPVTPPSPSHSPPSAKSSPAKQPALGVLQSSPKSRSRRLFSLSRRSTESMRSIDYLKKAARDLFSHDSRSGSVVSEETPEPHGVGSPVADSQGLLLAAAELKPKRSFSLFKRRRPSTVRVSNASTLVEVRTAEGGSLDGQNDKEPKIGQPRSVESRSGESMTSGEEEAEASSRAALTRTLPVETLSASGLGIGLAIHQPKAPSTENKDAPAATHQKQLGRMDTPEFIDAREYVVSPASEDVARSGLSGALTRVASPREDDEFSTAPSTPELSTGASSPRHSVLITPECLRTKSGTKDPALQDLYPVPPAAPASDSPTSESEIRGSGPSEKPPARAPGVPASGQCEAATGPADRLDASPSEPEACVGEVPAGSELGAGRGAEAGSGGDSVAGEEGVDAEKASKRTAGPDVDDGEGGVGDQDADGGPGLGTEELDKKLPASENVTAEDVGPVGETEDACSPVDADARAPEAVDSEKTRGPDSHTEVHVEPETEISDEIVSVADADPAPRAVSAEAEADFSGPGTLPKLAHDAEAAAADLVVPVPAGPATEGDIELGPTPNGPEISVDQLGNGHIAGDSDQKSPLKEEEQVAVSDLGSETSLDGNGIKEDLSPVSAESDATGSSKDGVTVEAEECISVPVLPGLPGQNIDGGAHDKSTDDPIGAEAAGRGALDGCEGESVMDPSVTGAAEAESSKLGSGEDIETESNPVPTVTLDGRNAGERPAEQSVTAPAGPEVVKPETPNGVVSQAVGQELSRDVDSSSDGIGGKDSYESEPCSDATVGNGDLRKKSFGPEAEIDATRAGPEVGDRRVCADRGTPAPDSHGSKHAAPATSVDSLAPHRSETSGSSTGAARSRSAVGFGISGETPEPARNPASTQQPAKAKPHVAPIPDLSKLPKHFPARTRTSLSSDAASFIGSTIRDSVDTIRPSTDEVQPAASPLLAEQPHTSSSSSGGGGGGRSKTAGYLGIGLRESRRVEVGLRGALGDVGPRRRRSLPLQHLLLPGGGEVGGGGSAAAAARSVSSGPAGKAGDSRKALRKGMGSGEEVDGDGDEYEYDSGRSAVPSLMMLLAGAVAIGKMLKGPGQ